MTSWTYPDSLVSIRLSADARSVVQKVIESAARMPYLITDTYFQVTKLPLNYKR